MDSLTLPEIQGIPSVEQILERPSVPLGEEEREVIVRAYQVAQEAHADQRRKSGEPYFVHSARVAWLLADMVNDWATIAAGLLHDVIEDCGYTMEGLAARFPDPVPALVDGVTKISSLSFSNDQEHQVHNLRKMILAMAQDVRVVMIKLCDRLHNMMTLEHLPYHRQRAIARSTLEIYAPLATRLGITRLRVHLEDLSMMYLYPEAHRELEQRMRVRGKADQEIVNRTREVLGESLKEAGLPARIQGRRKHLYSLHQKMKRQGLSFDEVHDILAIRVLTETITECYEILGIVHSIWKPLPGRFKDYIATPKENEYQSIHTTVIGPGAEVIEIQIRTEWMHRLAEEGIAAHWRYKEVGGSAGPGSDADDQKRLSWLRNVVEWLQEVRDPSEFMSELKRDAFDVSVYCFTPKGDIIEMPQGSTALDFAYRIHTQVGHHCSGVRINNRLSPIRTRLQTGDIVEILTSKSTRPTADWLQFVQSGRARNKIRHYLKTMLREQYLERGRRMLMDTANSRYGGQVPEEQIREILEPLMRQYSVEQMDDLMVEIGCGTLKMASVVGRLDKVLRPSRPKRIPRQPRRAKQRGEVVLVEGLSGAVTRLARCCVPLPGDEIVGFITQGRGISVHRTDCASLARIRRRSTGAENRLVEVQWGEASRRLQKAAVRLVCHDRKGLLGDVTTAIAQINVNIISANTNTSIRGNRAILKLVVLVEDSNQLNALLNRLSTIPGVIQLSRVVHAQ